MIIFGKNSCYRYYLYRRIGQSRYRALMSLWQNAPMPHMRISVFPGARGENCDSLQIMGPGESADPTIKVVS